MSQLLPRLKHQWTYHTPVPVRSYKQDPLLYKDAYIEERMRQYGQRKNTHNMHPHAYLFLLQDIKLKPTKYAQPIASKEHSFQQIMQRQNKTPAFVNL